MSAEQLFQPDDNSVAKELTCAICLSVFHDPVEIEGCGHLFCRACVLPVATSSSSASRKCPECRVAISAATLVRPHRAIMNMLNALEGKCSECEWRGTYESFHLSHHNKKRCAMPVGDNKIAEGTRQRSATAVETRHYGVSGQVRGPEPRLRAGTQIGGPPPPQQQQQQQRGVQPPFIPVVFSPGGSAPDRSGPPSVATYRMPTYGPPPVANQAAPPMSQPVLHPVPAAGYPPLSEGQASGTSGSGSYRNPFGGAAVLNPHHR